jgi:hypothetical protein
MPGMKLRLKLATAVYLRYAVRRRIEGAYGMVRTDHGDLGGGRMRADVSRNNRGTVAAS